MNDIPVIVLAAGEGTRLRPLTKYRPKPMLPAVTRPILEHVLDELLACGFDDIHLVVGHRRTRIQSHFGPSYRGTDLTYHTQRKQLGTGHAIMAGDPPDDGPVLVVYGDQIVDRTLITDVVTNHRGVATLGVIPGRDVSRYGGAIVEDGEISELVDRPVDNRQYFLNAGVYLFEPAALEAIRTVEHQDGEHSLIDGIVSLIESDNIVNAAVSDGFWADATYPWDLLYICQQLLDRETTPAETNIEGSPRVHASAIIREPTAIAPDCEIGPGAVVGPYAALGENVTVGANAVVERSVLDSDTRVGPNATLIETVTGVGTRIGAGSTIPGGPGDVRVGERMFEDESLGALLADRVVDQGGVTYLPGTMVGPDSTLAAGATARGTIHDSTTLGS